MELKVIAILQAADEGGKFEVVHEILPGETVEELAERLLVEQKFGVSFTDGVLLKLQRKAGA